MSSLGFFDKINSWAKREDRFRLNDSQREKILEFSTTRLINLREDAINNAFVETVVAQNFSKEELRGMPTKERTEVLPVLLTTASVCAKMTKKGTFERSDHAVKEEVKEMFRGDPLASRVGENEWLHLGWFALAITELHEVLDTKVGLFLAVAQLIGGFKTISLLCGESKRPPSMKRKMKILDLITGRSPRPRAPSSRNSDDESMTTNATESTSVSANSIVGTVGVAVSSVQVAAVGLSGNYETSNIANDTAVPTADQMIPMTGTDAEAGNATAAGLNFYLLVVQQPAIECDEIDDDGLPEEIRDLLLAGDEDFSMIV